jgi:hypothetical protein
MNNSLNKNSFEIFLKKLFRRKEGKRVLDHEVVGAVASLSKTFILTTFARNIICKYFVFKQM